MKAWQKVVIVGGILGLSSGIYAFLMSLLFFPALLLALLALAVGVIIIVSMSKNKRKDIKRLLILFFIVLIGGLIHVIAMFRYLPR